MEYNVVEGRTLLELIKEVNRLLLSGWKPCGGLSVTILTTLTPDYYFQAMIKE